MNTIDLAPIWTFVEAVADAYEQRRRHLATSKLLRGQGSTHLVGIAGQIGVALILNRPTDVGFLNGGDGGHDIDETDVKTTTYWPPILKHPVHADRWPVRFALAHLSPDHIVTYIGTVDAEMLREAGHVRTFHPDAGPQHCLNEYDVRSFSVVRAI